MDDVTYGRLVFTRCTQENLIERRDHRPLHEAIIETSDGEITVSIYSVRGQSVRIGIYAPRPVKIIRSELDYKRYHQRKTKNRDDKR